LRGWCCKGKQHAKIDAIYVINIEYVMNVHGNSRFTRWYETSAERGEHRSLQGHDRARSTPTHTHAQLQQRHCERYSVINREDRREG